MRFEEFHLERVSVFPVEACRNDIATFLFQDAGEGRLQLVPGINFGGDRPELRAIALDAMDALFALLLPSSNLHPFTSSANARISAQLDLRVTVIASDWRGTVPVTIWLGPEQPLLPVRGRSSGSSVFGTEARIGFQCFSCGHTNLGTNELGQKILNCFREVDRIRNPKRSLDAAANALLPTVIRIQSASVADRRRSTFRSGYRSSILLPSVGGADTKTVERALKFVRNAGGDAALLELQELLENAAVLPVGTGHSFELAHVPPGVRKNDGGLMSFDRLGTYELPMLKILSVVYAYARKNSFIVLDGLDRVLNQDGVQKVMKVLTGLSRRYNMKIIQNDRGQDWSYGPGLKFDLPGGLKKKLDRPTLSELHPQNKPSKLIVYVEGRLDKIVYNEMLGPDLAKKVEFINPHEDNEYCRLVRSNGGKPIRGMLSKIANVDGASSVIDAVNYRQQIHGSIGSIAYVGICDGDVSCSYGGMQQLLNTHQQLFTVAHKDIKGNLLFIPFHSIENVLISEGKALQYLSLAQHQHHYRDLLSGPVAASVRISGRDRSVRDTIPGGENDAPIVTRQDLAECYYAAIEKFRHLNRDFEHRSRKKSRLEFAYKHLLAGMNGMNRLSATQPGDDPDRDTDIEFGPDELYLQIRLCDARKLLNIAKSKIQTPDNWERGVLPLISASRFAAIFKEKIRSTLIALEI